MTSDLLAANLIASEADSSKSDAVDRMTVSDANLRQRIDAIGVEEVGRRYAVRTVKHLNAMATAEDPRFVEFAPHDDDWIDSVAFDGDQLTNDEFFRMILAALDAADEHPGALWCIADGPMDHLVGRDRSFALRFHESRRDYAWVQGAFGAMHNDLDRCGAEHGWWANDYQPRANT